MICCLQASLYLFRMYSSLIRSCAGTPSGVGPVEDGDIIKAGLIDKGKELAIWEGSAKLREDGYVFS